MRLFSRKSSTSSVADAEAEAEAEIRRAAEALGMVPPQDAAGASWPPPGAEPLPEEVAEEAVPAPGEADLPWEEGGASDLDEVDAAEGDPPPARTRAVDPGRQRVRKTQPRATESASRKPSAGTPSRARAARRGPGTTGP